MHPVERTPAQAGSDMRRQERRSALRGKVVRRRVDALAVSRHNRFVQAPSTGGNPSSHSQPSRRRDVDAKRPLRVIVVEDEAIIAISLQMILEELGAEVVAIAASADEALQLAEQHRPDCATVDISIKGDRDGVAAATDLYASLGIRSIFVSAFGDAETRERAEPARPVAWVSKPVIAEDLISALERTRSQD
jgi:two-component system, response regulator PdtaR